ncbi:hypothetical protein [Methyloferula stellata]|uniref:hypothetical protein n=1 Tax=Methyloferula stellata TaxID=876270 RepID=UPI00126900CD|nr:hypothetical protein [Methyloferula stellata]
MPDITECKIREAWSRFRPTGKVFDYTEKRPMRVRMSLQGTSQSSDSEKERAPSVLVELFLESGGLSGLPVFRIIGVVPNKNLKIILETIFDSGYKAPGQLSVQL